MELPDTKKITPASVGERIKTNRLELGLSEKELAKKFVGFRIKNRRCQLNMSRRQLADKCGFNIVALGHYENGLRYPPAEKILTLAQHLVVSTDWLNFGTEEFTCNNAVPMLSPLKLPVLTWENILLFPEGLGMGLIEVQEFELVIDHEFPTGCFCVDVEGDSMASGNFGRSFFPGTRLYVNPTLKPNPGDFVIAKINKNKMAIFRQYIVDSGTPYLKPLNMQYPVLTYTNDVQIIGVVVKASEVFSKC